MTTPSKAQARMVPVDQGAMADQTDTLIEAARVLAEHYAMVWSSGTVQCSCDQWKRERLGEDWKRETSEVRAEYYHAHLAHQAAMLAAAGLLR